MNLFECPLCGGVLVYDALANHLICPICEGPDEPEEVWWLELDVTESEPR